MKKICFCFLALFAILCEAQHRWRGEQVSYRSNWGSIVGEETERKIGNKINIKQPLVDSFSSFSFERANSAMASDNFIPCEYIDYNYFIKA